MDLMRLPAHPDQLQRRLVLLHSVSAGRFVECDLFTRRERIARYKRLN